MLQRKCIALALCWSGAVWLGAQPVLTNNVFPEIGDELSFGNPDSAGVSEGPAGASQVWDFSGLQSLATVGPVRFKNPAGTPYFSEFPAASLCQILIPALGADTTYAYYRIQGNELLYLGVVQGGAALYYSDPETLLKAPLTFGNAFTDQLRRYNNFADNTLNGTAHKTVTYDAYGQMKLPNAVFDNAIRLHTVTEYNDTTWLFAGYSISQHTDESYQWFVPGRTGAQLDIRYVSGVTTTYIGGLPPIVTEIPLTKSVTFVLQGATPATEASGGLKGIADLALTPNPAEDVLKLRFSSEKTGRALQIAVLDPGGRTLQTATIETFSGANEAVFLVYDLPAGAYWLSVSDGRSTLTLPWHKR